MGRARSSTNYDLADLCYACVLVSAPDPFRACAINTGSGGAGKNEGKGLAHRVVLARARAGMLARLERNVVISCNRTWITAVSLRFPFRKG